jgi:hypothetical protein
MRFLLFLIFISSAALGNEKNDPFILKVKIVEYNQGRQATIKLDSAAVLLYVDSVNEANFVSRKVQTGKDELSLSLPLGKNYLVGFEKQGYASKWITISTKNIPAKRQDMPFSELSIEIELFKKYPGIDYSILDKPLAAIVYNPDPNVDDFDYDKIYTMQIQPQLVLLKDIVRQTREKQRLYQAAIDEADKLFNASNWQGAKVQYNMALGILPNEQYPNDQVILCEQKLKEAGKPK